jgi:hypothetical protein
MGILTYIVASAYYYSSMIAGSAMARSNKYASYYMESDSNYNIRYSPYWATMTFAERQAALNLEAISYTCFAPGGLTGSKYPAQQRINPNRFPVGTACTSFRSELMFPT